MLAFEVHVNGKKVCSAGINEPGVITTHMTWVLGEAKGRKKASEQLGMRIGGWSAAPMTSLNGSSAR